MRRFNEKENNFGLCDFFLSFLVLFLVFPKRETIVSITEPPKGLTPAKGDGTDETKVIQAIFNYAASTHKTILIPANHTFTVDNLLLYEQDHFSIKGYGTLKHRTGATAPILRISACSNFIIEEINTDGNVEENETLEGGRLDETQGLHSVEIAWSRDFHVGRVKDVNPAADSVYLNDVKNGTIGTLIATADEPCGRNGLSIIKAENLTLDSVVVQNIGVDGMPSGIDFEPNRSTDDIRKVVIRSAKVTTAYGAGIAVTNQPGATVEDIEINGQVTKFGGESYGFMLDNVHNFQGKLKIVQEGRPTSYGARISRCDTVNVDLEIINAINGLDLGVGSVNVILKGKIIGTTQDAISIWKGLAASTIDMEIKRAGLNGDHGAVRISDYGLTEDVVFEGDYSYSGTGSYCFRVDGTVRNCRAGNINISGWDEKSLVTGRNAQGLEI